MMTFGELERRASRLGKGRLQDSMFVTLAWALIRLSSSMIAAYSCLRSATSDSRSSIGSTLEVKVC